MNISKYLFGFQLLWLSTASIHAQNLQYYQNLAQSQNHRLKAQEASAGAARSNFLKESIFKENPELMLGVMNVPVTTFPALNRDPMSGFVIGVSQKIALPWEDHYRKEACRFRAEFEQRDHELLMVSLAWEVAEKYNALQYTYHRQESLLQARRLMVSNLNIIGRSPRSGKSVVPQVLEARANLAVLDNERISTEYEIEKLWIELEALCAAKFEHEISGDEKKSWFAEWKAASLPAVFLIVDNLQYRKLKSENDAQTAMLSLSKSSLFPEVRLSAAYAVRQPIPGLSMGDNMVTVSASTPLPAFYPLKDTHEINVQSEKLKYSNQLLREAELQLEAAWRSEKLKMESLQKTIDNYTNSILPAHSSAHKSHLATASAQGMGVTEALQAFQMLINAEQERLKLIRDFYSAYYRLQFLSAKGSYYEK